MDWSKYVGKFVSVLIDGKNGKQENYLGTVIDITDGYMTLDTEANIVIESIIFQTNLIKSIWIYKAKSSKDKRVMLRDKYGLGHPKWLK